VIPKYLLRRVRESQGGCVARPRQSKGEEAFEPKRRIKPATALKINVAMWGMLICAEIKLAQLLF